MFSVELINNYDDFLKIESLWDEMVGYCEFPTVFQFHAWCKVWWNVYGKDKELHVLLVKKNSVPIGLAPLMLSGNFKKKSVEFIGTGSVDYADFIINPEFKKEALECVFKFLLQNREDWIKISLVQMSERTGNTELLKGILGKIDYPFRMKEIEQCHVFEYSNNNGDRENFESGLNKHRNLRNSVNFFKKNGAFFYKSSKDTETISKKLAQLFFFHWRRWEDTFTQSKFINPKDRKFYYELTSELCKNNNISLEELSVRNKPVAYVYSFLHKKTIFLYTASFDVFFRKKSPSTILYYYINENYIKNGYKCVDFMRGGEQYKEKLTNKSYSNYELVVYKNIVEYRFLELLQRVKATSIGKKIVGNSSINSIKLGVKATISSHGLRNAAKTATSYILRNFFQYRQMCMCELGKSCFDSKVSDFKVEFVEVLLADADDVAGFYGAEMNSKKHELVLKRFSDGNRCFSLKYQGIFVALCFVQYYSFSQFNYDVRFNFNKDDALLFDMCIIPEFQTELVKNYFYSSIEKNCQSNGYRSVITFEKNEYVSFAKILPSNLIELKKCNSVTFLNKFSFNI